MTNHLHLVTEHDVETYPEDEWFDGPPPRTRPSDRLEPWPSSPDALDALARAARERQIPFATAAAVIVERSLLDTELHRRGLSSLIPALDQRARAAQVTLALTEPQRAYLRAISTSRFGAAVDETPALVALPMRLSDRVAVATLDECLRPELLDSALIWEQAAAASGQSMSEWAAFAALEASARPN